MNQNVSKLQIIQIWEKSKKGQKKEKVIKKPQSAHDAIKRNFENSGSREINL